MEVIPLPIFLIYATRIDQSIPQDWLGPFVASSIAALITTTIALLSKVTLNRLMVGINLYLIMGSFALLTEHDWLNQVYGELEASGMLAWIIFVGVVSLLVSPAGFIGVPSQNRKLVSIFSLSLLLIAVIAFLASFFFQGNKLYSEVIPFLGLFATRKILHSKMTKTLQHDPTVS